MTWHVPMPAPGVRVELKALRAELTVLRAELTMLRAEFEVFRDDASPIPGATGGGAA